MRKTNLFTLILMSSALLINCGGNTPKKPDPKTFSVTCSSFVTITNPSAIEGQNYSTNLIAEEGIILPEVVKRVMINDQISTNYNYALESGSTSKATFSIASQYVIGSINIELELIHGYKVTCTEGVKVSNPIAVSNQLYATKLNVDEGFILPSEPISVKINGTEFARDKFYYQLMPESVNEALFTIDKENLIPGPIDIELDMHYVVTTNNDEIIVSNDIAVLGQDYETDLNVLDSFSFHSTPTRVTINGVETSNYTCLKKEENKVHFLIDKKYIHGPIHIDYILHDRFDVTTNAPHVIFSNPFAYSSIKYETELTVNNGVILPDTLASVKIKEQPIESSNYTYNKKSDNSASFIIDGQYVTGKIEIDLLESYTVTVEKGVSVTNDIAIYNEQYNTNLLPDEETVLPEDINKVKIKSDGKLIDTRFFRYEKKNDYAILNVFNFAITGPIAITLGLEKGYTVSLDRTDSSCPEINIDKKTAYTYEDYIATISFDNTSLPTKKMPETLQSVKCNDIEIPYTYTLDKYEKNKATIKIDKSLIKGKINILFNNVVDFNQWNDYPDWWNKCDDITIDDIGKEAFVTVNNHKHLVKLIDIDHDITTDKKTAHCTFEFENVISDNDGNAIYIFWNEGEEAKNYDFATSTLNKALNLNSDSVYSKLPIELQGKIKTAKKSYLKGSGYDNFTSKTYNAKLFPLSMDEISSGTIRNANGKEGTSYRYYNESDANKLKEKRKKCDLKGDFVPYWLRSPDAPYIEDAYYITKTGSFNCHFVGTLGNFTMAPAFCI